MEYIADINEDDDGCVRFNGISGRLAHCCLFLMVARGGIRTKRKAGQASDALGRMAVRAREEDGSSRAGPPLLLAAASWTCPQLEMNAHIPRRFVHVMPVDLVTLCA